PFVDLLVNPRAVSECNDRNRSRPGNGAALDGLVASVGCHVAGFSKYVAKLDGRFPMAEFRLALSLLSDLRWPARASHFQPIDCSSTHNLRSHVRRQSLRTWM